MSRSVNIVIVTASLVATACEEKNRNYCSGHPEDTTNCPPDGPGTCTADDQCPGEICDTTSGACVQCTPARAAACSGATPVCGDDNACTGCTAHAQCTDSDVCLPDGACGTDANVAYVDPNGTDNATCTKAMPCTDIADALGTGRDFVKLTGTTNASVGVVVEGGREVTFLADAGAKLTRSSGGAIVTARDDGTTLTIYDLSISDAPNTTSGIGLVIPAAAGSPAVTLRRVTLSNNPGGGISASGGTLTVSQSTLSGNTGGGITVMNATFAIVGNVFFNNGNDTTLTGGVAIGTAQNAANRLELNSFNRNKTQDGVGAAIHCLAGTFVARNNIMSENGTLTNMTQAGGTCMHAYSIVRPGTVPTGDGNNGMDPLFVNTTTGDLHLMPASPARDSADPSADLTGLAAFDIDGDPRVAPADRGADQAP